MNRVMINQVVGLLIVGSAFASAQGLCNVRQVKEVDEPTFVVKDVCFGSLLGVNDEVLADADRFPCAKGWTSIELCERFGDFTNAVMTVRKDTETGKLALVGVQFVKTLGIEADDKALLREYGHAVDLVNKLLGISVSCPGLVDLKTYLSRRPVRSDGRIMSRMLLILAKIGQRVEIAATEASYVIRTGQSTQIMAPVVEIRFECNGSFGMWRSSKEDSESVKELTLGTDCSDLLSVKMKALQEQSKLRELERAGQRQQLATFQEELKRVREAKAVAAKSECAANCATNKPATEKISVAEKLGECDFLLNKDLKKNAKFYLCLFSASWCGPCRREMPRIAKTYAETLKGDPDIELIHFSRDQNDEKALAWAKEHDVKFPVVKPKGGNPLDLHSRGIPHLFIVKADGTLVEEGHPMRIFNEEKFQELKGSKLACDMKPQVDKCGDRANGCTEKIDGYTWSYRVNDGEAEIVAEKSGKYSCAVSPKPTGCLVIPSVLGGAKVTSIGQNAFYCCSELTSVTIPLSVRNIGYDAFFDCRGLTSVTIPDGVTSIGGSAFSQCSGLSSVTIPLSVTNLGGYSFYYCSRLKSIKIPSSVTSIGSGSFNNCRGMLEFDVEDGNPAYRSLDGVLYDKELTSLIQYPCAKSGTLMIPSSVSSIGHGVLLGCRGLVSIDVEEGNPAFCSVDGILYDKDRRMLIQCPGGKSGVVRIPEGVTSIGSSGHWAFRECGELTSVRIPPSVTSIGQMAFLGCGGLSSVTIPASVTSIGQEAFMGCRGLRAIDVEEGNSAYCSVDGILYNNDRTTLVQHPGGKSGAVKIPSSVTSIGGGAFSDCRGLTSVTMCGERPATPRGMFGGSRGVFSASRELTAIHVPANAKSWAGMKEWQGIPLVFDAETK